jgi:protein SCO1/2
MGVRGVHDRTGLVRSIRDGRFGRAADIRETVPKRRVLPGFAKIFRALSQSPASPVVAVDPVVDAGPVDTIAAPGASVRVTSTSMRRLNFPGPVGWVLVPLLLVCAAVGVGSGCRRDGAGGGAGNPGGPVTNYTVRGVIQGIHPAERSVVIKHEAIPDYMMAMTMPFSVRDTNELRGLQRGDGVRFRLNVTAEDGWIDQVRVETPAPPAPIAPAVTPPEVAKQGYTAVAEVPELKLGDPVPDYVLTNQLGRSFKLSDFRGKALAFTFIFTRCPYPDFCPRMSSGFTRTMRSLRDKPGAATNWHLLSVSFDPAYDTPTTLAEYGRRYGYDPEWWSLASADVGAIANLGLHFGMVFTQGAVPVEQNHKLRTVVLDTRGRLAAVFVGNAWTAPELVEALEKAAAVKP